MFTYLHVSCFPLPHQNTPLASPADILACLQEMKPRIHLTQLEFDSITNSRALCDPHGNIGPTEFCSVMMQELRSYMQTRMTEHGFSEHRTPEDTEFTSLAATKMLLTEQFSLAQRIQTLLERIDPTAISSFPAAASASLLNLKSPCVQSAGGVRDWSSRPPSGGGLEAEQRSTLEAEQNVILQAVLRGQDEILRLVRQAESREAKTALAIRRMQDTINALHCVQTSTTTYDNAPSDSSAEDCPQCPVACSNCKSTCIHSSALATPSRPRHATPITVPTLPDPHDRFAHTPLLEPASSSQPESDQSGLQCGELPTVLASNRLPDRNVVKYCVGMFSARRSGEKVDGEGLRGRNTGTLGGAVAQAPRLPPAVVTSASGSDPSPHQFVAKTDFAGEECAEAQLTDPHPTLPAEIPTYNNVPSPGIQMNQISNTTSTNSNNGKRAQRTSAPANMSDDSASMERQSSCGLF